ncbi:group 4 capsule (G4C) polysaccharide, YmcB [Shigella flexneri]|nr:group 4 capsule (G4C) polysaccharide, YmcB [Shigella flexneri]
MIKQTIVALLLSVGASSVFAAGTVKVFSNGSSEAKTLTGAEHLIDLVGQPRLANSWWPGAVISEELATAAALRQQQALLTRLAEQGADSSTDDAAAINALRQQIQALKVTGRQKINLDPDIVRVAERGNPPLQGNYTLWVGPPPSTVTLFGLISHSLQVATWRAISLTRACSAVRIAATRGSFTRTDARKKRRWLTGTSVT